MGNQSRSTTDLLRVPPPDTPSSGASTGSPRNQSDDTRADFLRIRHLQPPPTGPSRWQMGNQSGCGGRGTPARASSLGAGLPVVPHLRRLPAVAGSRGEPAEGVGFEPTMTLPP